MKMTFGIVLAVIGVLLVMLAAFWCAVYRALEYHPEKIGKIGGFLQKTKYQKDVVIYGKNHLGPIKTFYLKHLTKGVYRYTVNGKDYKIRQNLFLGTPRQMQKIITVIYLKSNPGFSYIADDTNMYFINAVTAAGVGIVVLFLGAILMFGI